MVTRVLKTDPEHPESNIISEAAQILSDGSVVAFPTETVYGLGADALKPEGAKRIYEAKGRPSDNPLIVHIADVSALGRIAGEVPREAEALADAFWPGPLTMIFPKSAAVPSETTGGLDTVAVRMPSHPVALALIRESGGYIAAPSANVSGRPSPTTAEHVLTDLDGRIPLILDGGEVGIGIESTILDLTGDVPEILRPGYITQDQIAAVIGTVEDDPALGVVDDTAHPKAPGMKYRHYAPNAELILVSGKSRDVASKINALAEENREKGLKTGVLCTEETKPLFNADMVASIGSREDEIGIARHLYALLREFDECGMDQIYSECFSDLSIGTAIMNRLEKAAGHKMIEV
ncbi:MAG: threonylcarbamoyl-AMP synthase [Lachnospiraceae bacterium]|nr:threonylcarbamoyl-AMP synthase [Lachnospiraceae bacterium]